MVEVDTFISLRWGFHTELVKFGYPVQWWIPELRFEYPPLRISFWEKPGNFLEGYPSATISPNKALSQPFALHQGGLLQVMKFVLCIFVRLNFGFVAAYLIQVEANLHEHPSAEKHVSKVHQLLAKIFPQKLVMTKIIRVLT